MTTQARHDIRRQIMDKISKRVDADLDRDHRRAMTAYRLGRELGELMRSHDGAEVWGEKLMAHAMACAEVGICVDVPGMIKLRSGISMQPPLKAL